MRAIDAKKIFGGFVDFGEFCWTPVQDFSQNEQVLERSFYSGVKFVDFSLSEHVLERSFYSGANFVDFSLSEHVLERSFYTLPPKK